MHRSYKQAFLQQQRVRVGIINALHVRQRNMMFSNKRCFTTDRPPLAELSHVDGVSGRPKMVDVGAKEITQRSATAISTVRIPARIRSLLEVSSSGQLITKKKGPVIDTAIVAGTMAVKRTSDLIPFCHPLPVEGIDFDVKEVIESSGDFVINLQCTVKTSGKTGVEMEALTGSSIAALTVYDMIKALGHDISIEETRLLVKRGGKSDFGKS